MSSRKCNQKISILDQENGGGQRMGGAIRKTFTWFDRLGGRNSLTSYCVFIIIYDGIVEKITTMFTRNVHLKTHPNTQ